MKRILIKKEIQKEEVLVCCLFTYEEVEKEMANQKSEEMELPLSPKQSPTISEDQLLTEVEKEMPLVPLAKDYQRYEAEKIRAKVNNLIEKFIC